MNEKHACFREVIARGCVANVERCTCGTLHLLLGPFSLRLSPEQFRSLLGSLLEAQSSLEERVDDPRDSTLALARILSDNVARGQS